MMFSLFSRVDAECISPNVKNSIHVGDRILEINGMPIHNISLDEVISNLATLLLLGHSNRTLIEAGSHHFFYNLSIEFKNLT